MIEFDLVQKIKSGLATQEDHAPIRPGDPVRISAAIRLCPREEVLRSIHSVPRTEKIDSRLRRTFDFGRSFHTLVQNEWLGPWGMLWGNWECSECHQEFEFCTIPQNCLSCGGSSFKYQELSFHNLQYGITGHPDGILITGSEDLLLELKTVNSRQYKLVFDQRRAPLESHIFQVNLYLWITGLQKAVILYFDKDESMICQFTINRDERIVEMLLSRVQRMRDGIRDAIVPDERICDRPDCVRARSCVVRKLCWTGNKKWG